MVAKLSAQISESKSHENPEVPTVWAGPLLTASCFSEQQSAAGAQAAGCGRQGRKGRVPTASVPRSQQ